LVKSCRVHSCKGKRNAGHEISSTEKFSRVLDPGVRRKEDSTRNGKEEWPDADHRVMKKRKSLTTEDKSVLRGKDRGKKRGGMRVSEGTICPWLQGFKKIEENR